MVTVPLRLIVLLKFIICLMESKKTIYTLIFAWLINEINQALRPQVQRSAFRNAISWEPDISRKNSGNSRYRAFGNIIFPVPAQYRHSGLAGSRSRKGRETFGNSRLLPELKVKNLISALAKNFSTGTDLLIKFSTRQYFSRRVSFRS